MLGGRHEDVADELLCKKQIVLRPISLGLGDLAFLIDTHQAQDCQRQT